MKQTLARKVTEYYRGKPKIFKKCLQGLEELLKMYENWRDFSFYGELPACPLCMLVPPCGQHATCGHCPWTVLMGTAECKNMRFVIWELKKRQARIKQLRRWIAAYKKAGEVFSWRIK